MALFTVEVSGRPVLAFSEEDRGSAEKLLASSIGPNLLDLEEERGRPVLDGEEKLTVRETHPEEAARWEQNLAEAGEDDAPGGADDGNRAVFLIDVVDAGAGED